MGFQSRASCASKELHSGADVDGRGRAEDVLKGFESGADDYLPKPFNLAILLARIESLLRRKEWAQEFPAPVGKSAAPKAGSEESYGFGDKLVDFQNLRLHMGDKVVQLTLMEMELFRYLIRNAGHPYRARLFSKTSGIYMKTRTRERSIISLCACGDTSSWNRASRCTLFDDSRRRLPVRANPNNSQRFSRARSDDGRGSYRCAQKSVPVRPPRATGTLDGRLAGLRKQASAFGFAIRCRGRACPAHHG